MNTPFTLNLREAVYALSDALDFVGIDEIHHGKRVAAMAAACGRALGLDERRIDRLTEAGMLHDIGVSSTRTHAHLVDELDWHNAEAHCERGHWLLTNCSLLDHNAGIVLYHHTHWDQLQKRDIHGEVAEFANIIYMVDRVDALVAQYKGEDLLLAGRQVCKIIDANRDTRFASHLVDAFLEASDNDAFWLALTGEQLRRTLQPWLSRGRPQPIEFRVLRNLSGIFSNIVDAKSTFTSEHSIGVARLARHLAAKLGLEEIQQQKLEIAGLLHDLGKLRVPDEILEKPGPLTEEEMMILHHHSFDSYTILGRISGFEEIARWASDHHETISGKGYPYGREESELPIESRILAAADVFQALAQDRPYRPRMALTQILSIVRQMAEERHLDPRIITLIEQEPQRCLEVATTDIGPAKVFAATP